MVVTVTTQQPGVRGRLLRLGAVDRDDLAALGSFSRGEIVTRLPQAFADTGEAARR
jgi:hypothetical protein